MYKLYFSPGACSLATQVILRELNQPVELVNRTDVEEFEKINPTGAVPVLTSGHENLKEGAAIIFYLLDKYPNNFIPNDEVAKRQAIEDILFANATVHPAYSKLFFTNGIECDPDAKLVMLEAAAKSISSLWQVVETRLAQSPYLGGTSPSAADILLAVYQRWGQFFPVDIKIGPKAQAMVRAIHDMASFKASLAAETELS